MRELINCAYPCSSFRSPFSSASSASLASSLTLGSIGVDTGFVFSRPYFLSNELM